MHFKIGAFVAQSGPPEVVAKLFLFKLLGLLKGLFSLFKDFLPSKVDVLALGVPGANGEPGTI